MSRQQVLDLVDRWAQAELHGDVAAYDDLLTVDFAGIGPVGFVLGGRQWAGRHQGPLENHHFAILEPQVRFYGDTAVVSGVQDQRTTAMGRDTSGSFRLTLVAVRQDERWLIANIQLSGPLQDPGAPPPFARDAHVAGDGLPVRPTISREELRSAIDTGAVTVVDGLPEPAYRRRHLPGALNLTAEDAEKSANDLLPDRSAPIVAYSTDVACTRGPGLVAELKRLGYRDVRLYAEGIEDWAGSGLPVESSPA
ncbi:DUF4440 domain-containing protein [Planotetraspora kaengkrachanensis]|uniref:Rhodanese domain-containing protein n=1 Tax=Planotetraspora kaengkrachanensis TaxID=575193 RepID=A0A8J3PXE5_9ACTN|nr:DUF4440 domain-containing protein [Planotetraspora kaengkrachanensis]GIG82834.1 hypothetical protein Pka01_59610 [Planotetraspora kaengkrachanensis]